MYVSSSTILLLISVTFITILSILDWGLKSFKNKQVLLEGSIISSMSKSNIAIFGLVFFYNLCCFLGAWLINNKFASKLADKVGVAIREYLFNK